MNTYFRIILTSLFLALILSPTDVSAKHIIGGFFRYDHLGGGNYRFQLYVYRDCRPQENAATLDNPIPVGVYFGNPNGNGYSLQREINVPLRRNSPVFAPEQPCLSLPPNLCVEEGFYEFEYRIPGWPRNQPVVLSYQRCCRNNTISNITTPGEVGATFTVEITPFAMATGNSSPNFNEFPPTAICNQFPLEFDHSATDPDGDSLAYVFCSPLVGGGLVGSDGFPGDARSCIGIIPTPACPPPYSAVNFVDPAYSVGVPLGGDPVVELDSETGMITGVPTVLGQFVAAVCVEEWRNGQLLSVTLRDFQFNVTDCTAAINAEIEATEKLAHNQFYIRSCGSLDLNIKNISEENSIEIDKYLWLVEHNGFTEMFDTEDLFYEFPDYGRYNAILIANPELPCTDTAFIIIDIFEDIIANYSFIYDTCNIGPVQFSNSSVSFGGEITDIFWDFGDGNNSTIINPSHTYENSNNYNVTLLITDENGCQDFQTRSLEYFPIPIDLILRPLDTVACQPFILNIDNINSAITDDYIINWDFGDGTISNLARPLHVYNNPGIFSLSLNVENLFGCKAEYTFDESVTVLIKPEASFNYTPAIINRLISNVTFNNSSINADTFLWDFGDGASSTQFNPIHNFQDTGLLEVYLFSVNENGCRDTAYTQIDNVPVITFYMPNAFSPDGDGINDSFYGKGILDGYRKFNFKIFNRYGQLLFESTDPEFGWNGRLNNNGVLQTSGVYVYKVEMIDPRGNSNSFSGSFILVR